MSDQSATPRTDALREPYVIYKKERNGTYSSCVSKIFYDNLREQFAALELEAAALRERLAKAETDAIRLATIERCAKVCESRAENRFVEYGITEPDTNASYYPKSHEWCEGADEEANDCAAAIRQLKEKS